MAMGAFPKFVHSQLFRKWYDKELRIAEHVRTNAIEKFNAEKAVKTVSESVNSAEKAIACVDQSEVDNLLRSGDWFTTLITAVENLPICVSISSASQDKFGFPLVYVNSAFETTTGYSRSEIVGKNCRFLQADVGEPEAVAQLSKCLREAKPIRVAISNKTRDGKVFKNLLAMKPIFDEAGNYAYVVGVQFDVTDEGATAIKLKLANDLINMIPEIIYT